MKRTVALLISVTLFISMLVLGVVSKMQAQQNQQQQACSLATLNGSYGILVTGFFQGVPPNIAPTAPAASNPFANVGTVNFNGAGGAVGQFTFSENGTIFGTPTPVTQIATYTVNPDCTGFILPPNNAKFVIVDQAKELLFIITNPGAVQTAIAIKQ